MKLTRRTFVTGLAVTGVTGLIAPSIFKEYAYAGRGNTVFNNKLAIPPELKGTLKNGVKVFDLNLQQGISQFWQGRNTPTAGINGAYLGPTIRVAKGDKIRLNVTNNLSETSTLHWHGVRLPAVMDGGPHQPILQGQTWVSEFDIRQVASTQWYHPHTHHRTAVQVYSGLAGLFYIDDDASNALDLPSEYGVDDIPVVIQDRAFAQDGSFRYGSGMHTKMMGMTGSYMLVNGTLNAHFDVQKKLTRFRILNGSNARIYNLAFSDGRSFKQIASDGGLFEKPVEMQTLTLAPAERAEIVVAFAENDKAMLIHKPKGVMSKGGMSRASSGMGKGMGMGMMEERGRSFGIMSIGAKNIKSKLKPLPNSLVKVRRWSERDAVKTRIFALEMVMGMMNMMAGRTGVSINGKRMDMSRIDEKVKLNDIEIWEIENHSPMAHPFHVHNIQFQILDRNGQNPPLNEQGLKDTVLVQPSEKVRIILQFEDYTDAQAPYMYHCHILEHEDAGMMGQFVVVDKV